MVYSGNLPAAGSLFVNRSTSILSCPSYHVRFGRASLCHVPGPYRTQPCGVCRALYPMHADQWFLAHCLASLGRAARQPLTHLSCCRLIIVSIALRPALKSRTPGKCSGQHQWQGQLQCLQPSSGRLQQRGGQDPRPTCRHAPGPRYR
jgi:hypothetical protein